MPCSSIILKRNNGKQSKCQYRMERYRHMWEYYTAVKTITLLLYAITWMNFIDIMSSKVRHKTIYNMEFIYKEF